MNKAVIVLAVFAAVVLVAECKPVLPKRRICSIQATGTAQFITSDFPRTGTVTMKRVNEVVLYEFTDKASSTSTSYNYGFLLLRPDLNEGIYRTCETRGSNTKCQGGSLRTTYPLASYKYSSDFKPVKGDYECFAYSYNGKENDAAMLFSSDGRMDLIGEWFKFSSTTLTFSYDSVREYEHNVVDNVFSLSGNTYGAEWGSKAQDALTRKCDDVVSDSSSSSNGSAVVMPSFIALIVALLVYALF